MSVTTENGLKIIRHDTDRMTSVYRAGRRAEYLGSALPILRPADYAITGWTASGPDREPADFMTEQAAIDYLTTRY